ncbi:MAG: Rpn family recombination-promoting nuclease/putative transposase [Sphingobacteriales bacterium]|nr:MAG: Rpn family recombination-promoting nuclease/putative transposase [Sphingobacteriales bacterium]TAF81474.1 MAG: Rpn family recombination-promoting nuclease/putative transposase [Sphingobacteriales bacterium]
MKFVDITNDIAFRKIFGNNSKKKSLISFLNAVIDLPQNEQIIDVEITNPYQLGKLSGGKSTIVDVKAKDEKGNTFIVEMQVAELDYFNKRILYYTSQSYVLQINKGVEYNKLKPVYFIGILEFEIAKNKNYFSRHKVLDVETKEQIIQDIEFNFIEIPKFNKTIDQLETSIDQWTYFIKNAENLTLIPESVKDEGLKEAYTEADKQNWTKQELEDYERASIKERDEIGRLDFAVKKAEKKGKVEGKMEVAKSLKQNGVSLEIIITATGLTKNEIENL